MKHLLLVLAMMFVGNTVFSQDQGVLSGSLETNFNYFQRDSVIGAANIPQYDRELTGGELWLNLNYSIKGYDMGVRFDMFNNSNLLNPTGSYTDQGIGRWFIKRTTGKLQIEAGYLYDQIGSGIIYQAYEVRPQLLDNALLGGSVKYKLSENWDIKGFMGRQKFLFEVNPGNVKGIYLEGFKQIGSEDSPISLAPGIGFVNRTHNDETVNSLVNVVKNYEAVDAVVPTYNTYLSTFYNTLTYKGFTWYVEAAYKSPELFFDPEKLRARPNGAPSTFGKYVRESGSVIYNSIGLSLGKLGLTVEAKRTENFDFRSDPTLRLNFGLVNFIPPMNRLNTYRLTSRYSPATQLLSEQAIQLDATYKFNRAWTVNANYSNIQTLDGRALYPTEADGSKKKVLYPTVGAVYINKGNRFSLRYVKQVEGVVCNGGVCRLEPAFSGVRFTMTSNF